MSEKIRVVKKEDSEKITKLIVECFGVPERMAAMSTKKGWLSKLEGQGLSFVYEEDGELLGYISGYLKNGKVYISDFCMNPEHRGKGIGTKLLLKQREEALKRRITSFWGTAFESNKEAIRLYNKLGFTIKPLAGGMVVFTYEIKMRE